LVSQRCGGGASEGAPVQALAVGFNTWHLAKGVRPRVSGDNGHAGQWSTTNPGTLQNKRVLKNKKAVRSFWYALTTSNTNISMVPSKKYTYLIEIVASIVSMFCVLPLATPSIYIVGIIFVLSSPF